ncbi:hypothetical protein DY023_12520 [Microbacterium bovistercoris]|uniref:Uncharacterized protein n=1 Tax=Microbacterium bovistercoris TaxID=2293570 RepID=A0A371NRE1_9MICO|nr:hypothetical protein [Microbacterium bovistercoris]REJ04738.1 hypothetical protein DY023_12520 [Microbacterium bovistercoris]
MFKKSTSCALAAGIAITLGLSLAPAAMADTAAGPTPAAVSGASQLDALRAELPADWAARVADARARFGLDATTWADQTRSVIDGSDYQCASTPVNAWLTAQLAGVDRPTMRAIDELAGFDLATYDALIFGAQDKRNTFGYDGSYTNDLNRTMDGMKKFWDFDGSDIQLIPMHGDTYRSIDRMVRVYTAVYGLDAGTAREIAEYVQSLILSQPGLRQGDNPYFTFNAFAFDPAPEDVEQFPGLTKRIIMGDGVMAGLRGIGLQDKAAPLGVLAHEYGHQVQYANNLFESPLTGPEATRRTELMADAYGTYYLVHARGGALNAARTLDVQASFYNVGDCAFTNDGHHGTPNQRLKSATFGASVVEAASNQGHKLGALAFDAKFEAVLPEIVAPDAH